MGTPNINLTAPGLTAAERQAIANQTLTGEIAARFEPQYGTIPGVPDGVGFLGTYLRSLGLADLIPWAERQLRLGTSPEQVELELWEQPAFKTRFKGIFDFQANFPDLAPPSPADVIAFETQTRQMMREAGMPEGFYDEPSDFQDLIGGGLSVREVSARINEAFAAIDQGPQDVMGELDRLYGVSRGELAAWALDEDRALPAIMRQVQAAQLGGAARRADFTLDADRLEELAAFGITQSQAQAGFQQLAGLRPLFEALPGEGVAGIGVDEQLGAAFMGDTAAQRALQRRGQERTAQFGETGGALVGQSGTLTFQ
ncbi:MAG: hypothetical protein WAT66_14590 [Actinomycetota bacterium]